MSKTGIEISPVQQVFMLERDAIDARRAKARAAKVAGMNAVADVMVEDGPTMHLEHFLFAMYGVLWSSWPESAKGTQKEFEKMESEFPAQRYGIVFSSSLASREAFEGLRIHAYDNRLRNSWLDERSKRGDDEYSSFVQYSVSKQEDCYIGRVIVPSFQVVNFASVLGGHSAPEIGEGEYMRLRVVRRAQSLLGRPDYRGGSNALRAPLYGAEIAAASQFGSLARAEHALGALSACEEAILAHPNYVKP